MRIAKVYPRKDSTRISDSIIAVTELDVRDIVRERTVWALDRVRDIRDIVEVKL